MTITACYPFVTTEKVAESKAYYRALGYAVVVEGPAWTHLAVPGNPTLQLGLLDIGHESVGAPFDVPGRLFLGLMVSDADAAFAAASAAGDTAEPAPEDMPWGQRRFTAIDPDGNPIDIAALAKVETPFTRAIRTLMAA
jgi:catechol 2,3-dioxygenase-like lactoylglutathione lyase family enzyme